MPTCSAEFLLDLTRRIFEAAGTPERIAARVSHVLVDSNLTGHDSHGVLRIPAYVEQIEKGSLRPAEEPEVLKETAATALVDARQGWGHYAADWALELATRKAAEAGTCTIVLHRCNHIGRLGEYVERAARAGFISSVTVGHGARGLGCSFPLGGAERALGTNPFAFGVPTGDDTPFVIDFATTVVAEGKIQVARSKGVPLPPGCITDAQGRPTIEPSDFYDGGSILFAGGHKGYALSLLACLTAGLNGDFQPENWRLHGVTVQALDPRVFLPLEDYQRNVRQFLAGLKSCRAADGQEILYPGEPEYRSRRERAARGVEIPESIWAQIQEAAGTLGVPATTES